MIKLLVTTSLEVVTKYSRHPIQNKIILDNKNNLAGIQLSLCQLATTKMISTHDHTLTKVCGTERRDGWIVVGLSLDT